MGVLRHALRHICVTRDAFRVASGLRHALGQACVIQGASYVASDLRYPGYVTNDVRTASHLMRHLPASHGLRHVICVKQDASQVTQVNGCCVTPASCIASGLRHMHCVPARLNWFWIVTRHAPFPHKSMAFLLHPLTGVGTLRTTRTA